MLLWSVFVQAEVAALGQELMLWKADDVDLIKEVALNTCISHYVTETDVHIQLNTACFVPGRSSNRLPRVLQVFAGSFSSWSSC